MNKNFAYLYNKYKSDYNEMFNTVLDLSICNREKCKKEFEELEKYKEGVLSKLSELKIKESETSDYKVYNQKKNLLIDEFNKKKSVIDYFEGINKGNHPLKDEIVNKYVKEAKIHEKKIKKLLKEYHKTEIGKYYMKESEKLLKDLSYNIKSIPLAKCSYKKCVELHKKGLQSIKKIAQKLCNDKKKKSCKILKAVNKIDFNNINLKQNMKLKKMLEKGFV